MTFNPLIFMFCLLLMNNLVMIINGTRQLNNIPLDEKEAIIDGSKVENQVDPNKNNEMEKTKVYPNQFLPPFPFPNVPMPGIPSFPFPPFPAPIPVDIPNPPFPLVPTPPME
ncbi:unnamed protein product [Trifolium pratense]|uniref:Uncharacterized protein n=1 Tax=Trifolium pratense TaxID=57577 RepID=A0ACB0KA75_TRIPR|nr:unnamed protein product [Trifolium pratense]